MSEQNEPSAGEFRAAPTDCQLFRFSRSQLTSQQLIAFRGETLAL
jgi:hypothetical protein